MVRFGGPPDIGKIKAKRDVAGLIQALGYRKEPRVRRQAARALGEIRDLRAVDPLLAALKDADTDVCWAAAEALAEIGDVRAVDALIAAHQESHAPPWIIVEALGKITAQLKTTAPATRAVKALIVVLGQPTEYVGVRDAHEYERQSALTTLVEIGCRGSSDPVGSLVLDLLREAYYQDTEPFLRDASESALAQIGTPAQALIAADLRTRGRAQAAAGLLDILGVPENPEVQAYHSVAKKEWERAAGFGAPAVPPLVEVFDSSNKDEREAAAAALLTIGLPSLELLASALNRYENKGEIATLLGRIGADSGDPALRVRVARLLTPLLQVASAKDSAADALAHLGDQAVKPLVTALNSQSGPMIETAAQALTKMATESHDSELVTKIVESLIAALHYGDWATRLAAAKELSVLYRNERLEPRDKQRIVDLRGRMAQQHEDYAAGPLHEEIVHTDIGVGWTFEVD